MFISHFYLEKIDVCNTFSTSRNRRKYYEDLYERYHMPFSVKDNSNINYQSIMDQLIARILQIGDVNFFKFIFFPKYFHFFGEDCAVPEFYLKNKYGFNQHFFEIRDCDRLCLYEAIFLGKTINENIILIMFESDFVIKKDGYMGFLILSKHPNKKYEILSMTFQCRTIDSLSDESDKKILDSFGVVKQDVMILSHADYDFSFHAVFMLFCLNKFLYSLSSYLLIVDTNDSQTRDVFVLIKRS